MKVIYYGQSCLAVEIHGKSLVFDPFVRQNELARDVDFLAIRADHIFITHGHFDHVADAADLADRTGAPVTANPEVCEWLKQQGVKEANGIGLGGKVTLPFCRVKYVNAVHGSTLPDGTPGGLAGGFVVESDEGNFYHAGDTALTADMGLIGQGMPLTFAALPIGGHFTMDAEDAARAADLVRCNRVLGMHYDTFPPIRIDHEAARRTFQQAGKELILLPVGGSHDF